MSLAFSLLQACIVSVSHPVGLTSQKSFSSSEYRPFKQSGCRAQCGLLKQSLLNRAWIGGLSQGGRRAALGTSLVISPSFSEGTEQTGLRLVQAGQLRPFTRLGLPRHCKMGEDGASLSAGGKDLAEEERLVIQGTLTE